MYTLNRNALINLLIIKSNFMSWSILMNSILTVHSKCRVGFYPRSNLKRFPVPDDKVDWSTEYKQYNPPNYTFPGLHGKPYADPEIGDPNFEPLWNSIDGNISRVSYNGPYQIVNGFPLNPLGRTGICGRGVLGRWGPNHAADPIISRWKRLDNGNMAVGVNNKPILQFIAIKRGDTGEWAIPGGMVDPGEKVSETAIREFKEEALNSLSLTDKIQWEKEIDEFFSEGEVIYQGYVDDCRNTDNSWIETIAYNFHDESGLTVGLLKLHAGDDAVGVRWVDITPDLKLYASHTEIVNSVLKLRIKN